VEALREAEKQRDVMRAVVIAAAKLAPAHGVLSGLLNAAAKDAAHDAGGGR
jgi:hypothetical protein